MSDLTDFLNARLDDDEAWAKAGLDAEWPEFNEPGTPGHHARVLADCDAKRDIMELHEDIHTCTAYVQDETAPDGLFVDDEVWVGPDEDCSTLRVMAEIYADHPDYREEWRP